MATAIDISGVSEDATNLRDMLEGILERVESVFQSHNVNLPKRRYWTLGDQPVVDCEQVVVTLIQLYLGAPGAPLSEPQRCNQPRTATLAISISREVPVVGQNGKAPSPERISLSSSYAAIDAWVLMQSVNLFDMWEDTGYGLGVIATLETSPPEGGFQTVVLQITMAVP